MQRIDRAAVQRYLMSRARTEWDEILVPGVNGWSSFRELRMDIGTSVDWSQSRYAVIIAAPKSRRPILSIYRAIVRVYRPVLCA